MKYEGAIRHKLKKVVYYHLKQAIRNKMSQKSWNCMHESTDPSPFEDGEMHRVCYTCTVLGGQCDDTDKSAPSRARQCSAFKAKHDTAQIKAEFLEFLGSAGAGEIAFQYPDAFALMWVLDRDSVGDIASAIEGIPTGDMLPPDPTKPLVDSMGEVRDAMVILSDAIAANPQPLVDPALRGKVDDLASRLNDMQTNLPAAPKGFWASLFSLK